MSLLESIVKHLECIFMEIILGYILLELGELGFVHLLYQADVKVDNDVVELLDVVSSINQLLLEFCKLWDAFGVQFFEVVVFSESLEVPPEASAVFARQQRLDSLDHSVDFIAKLL